MSESLHPNPYAMSPKKHLFSSVFSSRSSHHRSQAFRGFTLVELIIVITILIILGTIAFVSLQGHTSKARDGARVADVWSIKTTLEIFYTKNGSYPLPSDPLKTVTYSGAIAFYEGTFGESVLRQVQTLNKQPKDPLYKDTDYTYSIINNKNQYQVGYVMENPTAYYPLPMIETAFADGSVTPQIEGTYSGSILVSTGGTDLTYESPTIVTSYSSSGTFDAASLSGTFVTDGWTENIPFSYLAAMPTSPDSPPPAAPIGIAFTDTDGIIVTCSDCIVYP